MTHRNLLRRCSARNSTLLVLVGFFGLAAADPIDDAEDLPATPAEMVFINEVVEKVTASVPEMDGWTRKVGVTVSGNTVREGEHPLIYERARGFPLKISMSIDFREIMESDREKQANKKSAQELQEEMMAAAMRGDTETMEKLQQELAAMMEAQMTAGPMGQAVGATPVAPVDKPDKFYVQAIVNGDGENIGKQYDIDVPGVAKAFRVDKGSDETIGYKYYLGGWDVTELDAKNWRIVASADEQTAANHLQALALFVSIYGDKDSTENYIADFLDVAGLNSVVD